MGFVKAWHDASVGARPWWIYISHIRGAKIVADRGASANITCPLGGGADCEWAHTYPVEAIDRRNSMQKIDITSVDLGRPAMLVLVSTDILHLQPSMHEAGDV